MLRRFAFALLTALSIVPAVRVLAMRPAASDGCARLASIALPDTTIRTAAVVAGPSFTPPGGGNALKDLPQFCRVAAVSKPAVSFEVWLPLAEWNGKFQGVGNGANAGSISYPAMATALRHGYATASTDTGHATTNSRDAAWAVGHPELLIDFGYRAIHLTAEHAKRIVAEFYRKAASHSYFVSCSTGGRQALMEAQRFPDDYDGIVAGAPAANWSRFQTGGHLWAASALNKDPERYVPASKLRLLQNAVLAACDAKDGVKDGVLDDPRRCAFDPQTLVCANGADAATCFTPKQVAAIEDLYAGSRDSAGRRIYPGYMPGAEAEGGWAAYMTGSGPLGGNHWEQAENVLKYMVFENPTWDFRSFDFDKDVAFTSAKLGQTFDAFDPDLARFRRNGGKLLLYHGWNDPSISPLNTIDYYERVVATIAKSGAGRNAETEAQSFVRLFMVPGMLHCGGGPGPNTFDIVGALERWAERGQAPDSLIASHAANGAVDRTRPLCVYPKVAVYSGTGSTDDAANFACRAPR
jgi:tannase/feruloyl esterase